MDKLHSKIRLMNELSSDAYSVANLPLLKIFDGCVKKEKDPYRIWKALHKAYGEDYFLNPIEKQYGKRFVQNYNALYYEVNKVEKKATDEIKNLQEVCATEVQE